MSQKIDNIIVGGGIAGVWMAYRLAGMGRTYALFDVPSQNHSSRVAAGIFNPVLSRRQKLSFNAREIYPDLVRKYHELEIHLHEKFLHRHRSAYIIESLRELNDWAALSRQEKFSDFVMIRNERIDDAILSDFGYLDIQESGWVDIPLMLDTFISGIREPNHFVHEIFHTDELQFDDGGFTYRDFRAENIIFCQGTAMSRNPLTEHIRLKPAKGEIMLIEAEAEVAGMVPQNGVFMLPVGEKRFRVGSNFTWEDLSTETTAAARNEILGSFTRWFKGPFEPIGQVAGIRPASLDRRPLVGRLDFHPRAFILNGLGSKGVSLAPYYSEMLLGLIYDGIPVAKDVDVKRFI